MLWILVMQRPESWHLLRIRLRYVCSYVIKRGHGTADGVILTEISSIKLAGHGNVGTSNNSVTYIHLSPHLNGIREIRASNACEREVSPTLNAWDLAGLSDQRKIDKGRLGSFIPIVPSFTGRLGREGKWCYRSLTSLLSTKQAKPNVTCPQALSFENSNNELLSLFPSV